MNDHPAQAHSSSATFAHQGVVSPDVDAVALTPDAYISANRAAFHTLSACLALPFDIARERYARAVRVGLIERSMLQSARFSAGLTAVERITLGPWARRI
jgi:hypothetical protein